MTTPRLVTWQLDFHRALSNPTRLEIAFLLAEKELCQCDIFPKIGVSQSTVSAYLTQMVRAGILRVRTEGTRKIYSLSDPRVNRMLDDIRGLAQEKIEQ